MTPGPWRTAYASAVGTSHIRTETPCQDAGCCEVVLAADGSEVLVASVADGAGSAQKSDQGAQLAVDMFQRRFADLARDQPGLEFLDRDQALAWLSDLQSAVAVLAAEADLRPRDYACTFLGAVVGPTAAAFVQIGDGAIVVSDSVAGRDGHSWVFWPQHGEFANSTFFVTMDDAAEILLFERREMQDECSHVWELAMFSDGIERLVLDMSSRTVHSPSLRPILDWVAATQPATTDGAPSDVLASYLSSPNVNRRTDDDKTLVLAARARPALAEEIT